MAQWNKLWKNLWNSGKKYKYAALILLLGLFLLLLPSGKEKQETIPVEAEPHLQDSSYAAQTETALREILSQIRGAGQVEVMLSLRRGSLTHYQLDTQRSDSKTAEDSQNSLEQKTVILSEGSAYDKAAISAVEYPQFLGALIVCEGADQASVRLALVEAVSSLTGLSSDQITVVKMK